MKHLIAHRGNITGKNIEKENQPDYIDYAIERGFDVEVDIWLADGGIYLGHDNPQYLIKESWIFERSEVLWIHCKNIQSLEYLTDKNSLNYFWHEEDTVTLTSKNFIWAFPGNQPIKNSIAVMPEIFNDDTDTCLGICSDDLIFHKDAWRL